MKRLLISVILLSLVAAPGCWFWQQDVTVHGPGNEKLKITAPDSISVTRGETTTLEIGIERTGFDDPVQVSLSNIPEGISVDNSSKSVQTTKATFVLTADVDAPIVSQPIKVTAQGPHDMEAVLHVGLDVELP
jgi:hypothetical protein